MQDITGIDWQDAFENGAYIKGADGFKTDWAQAAQKFRAAHPHSELGLPYGQRDREILDVFYPSAAPAGTVVFIHGGYWRAFDPSYWSHLAAGALHHGYAVAMPGYDLTPHVSIPQIVQQVAAAISFAAQKIPGPLVLTGHSAGGHLAARMSVSPCPLPQPVQDRIRRIVPISGLFDLRPLRLHTLNRDLRIDNAVAAAHSPALLSPLPGVPLRAWVGARERPEFLRQSALYIEKMSASGADADLIALRGAHHFDVINGLQDPHHPLTQSVLGLDP